MRTGGESARPRDWAKPMQDIPFTHNFLDFRQILTTVQDLRADLVFAIWPPIFCQPTSSEPVSNPKGF
jgi:hypothetical protein